MSHYLRYGSQILFSHRIQKYSFKKFLKILENLLNHSILKIKKKNCKVNIVDTGLSTLTGGRLKK